MRHTYKHASCILLYLSMQEREGERQWKERGECGRERETERERGGERGVGCGRHTERFSSQSFACELIRSDTTFPVDLVLNINNERKNE